jgi:galactose mutarotase-like enzyme
MEKIILLTSDDQKSVVKIDNGELISYQKEGKEYIHQKGNLGWNNSDTEMFPVIGPTIKNKYLVLENEKEAVLDQHGLLREIPYQLENHLRSNAVFFKKYDKNTLLKNRKYPEKSPKKHVYWKYDFSFKKYFSLTNNFLEVGFEFVSETEMPFMLGYHPAFNLSGLGTETIEVKNKVITLNNVLNIGADAFPLLNCTELTLHNTDKNNLKITTKGFNNFMLWTEVSNMICIEPITQFPSLEDHKYTDKNMRISSGKEVFSVKIEVQ